MSLISFCLILAGIRESWKCDAYRDNEDLNAWMPNYRVSLGFGLHIGWAIEGAIGSTFKIDASYLSPNVNMSNILEAATKDYGVPFLFTNHIVNYLSDKFKEEIWQVDSVTIGLTKYDLYTVDINLDLIELELKEVRKQTPLRVKVSRIISWFTNQWFLKHALSG